MRHMRTWMRINTGKGVERLQECIRKIKHDPTDRWIILNVWNLYTGMSAPPPFFSLLQPNVYTQTSPEWRSSRAI